MAPHIESMRLNLSADLGCSMDQINIKATTTEKLGFVGRQEGIACHAVVLLNAAV
jgi:2-C-methyl-D-erythritol 2,4-cyclodiphosphate synthase